MHRDNHDSKLLISATTQSARLRDPRREFTRLQLIDSAITNSSERSFASEGTRPSIEEVSDFRLTDTAPVRKYLKRFGHIKDSHHRLRRRTLVATFLCSATQS